MRARGVLVIVVMLVALTAACASDDTSSPAATTSSPAASTSPPSSGSASPSEEPVADVVMSNFFFSPDQITVTSGDILSLFNSSTTSSHTFTIPDAPIDAPIDVVVETQTEGAATIELEAGTYELICKFHEASGMVGTLVVEPVAA